MWVKETNRRKPKRHTPFVFIHSIKIKKRGSQNSLTQKIAETKTNPSRPNVMTKNLQPTASSSYEDSSSSSEEETDSPVVKPRPDSTSKVEASLPLTTADSSSEEEEEETDSDSEPEPVSAKPKTTAKSLSAVKPPPAGTKKKRSCEIEEGGEAKRVKRRDDADKKMIVGQEEGKKNYFQRVWREEDEITVLQGIIDYQNETGLSAFDDKAALYELMKKSISFEVTKVQFLEKIRGLKKKYDNNRGKEEKRGETPSFSKPHDLEVFRLSKFVWGDEGIMAKAPIEVEVEVDPPVLKKKKKDGELVSVVESMARFGVDELFAKKGWVRLSSEDKKRLEEELEALQLEELRLYSRKSRFINDAVTTMVEACQQDR